jgi:hypothetical protein
MRFPRRRQDHALIIGILKDRDTKQILLKRLQRPGFHRATTICAHSKGNPQVKESRVFTAVVTLLASIIGALIAALVLWQQKILPIESKISYMVRSLP